MTVPQQVIDGPAADRSPAAPSPQQHVLTLLSGKMIAAVICVLARVGVADHLAQGPRGVTELAAATSTDAPMLYRFLRAAASAGVFTEQADGCFALTPAGECLRSDAPGTLRYLAYLYGEESVWNCFGSAIDTLRTGEPAGPKLRGGKGWFEYMDQDPEFSEIFHRAMTGVSHGAPEIARACDFRRFSAVADIGGGQGRLLAAILARNPHQRGILFDTASAVQSAPPVLQQAGVAHRVGCVAGDFFRSVPAGCDAYVLKAVLHDWNDQDAARILRNVRAALGGNGEGRVFVIEAIVPDGDEWHFSKAMDIAMAVSLGGKERNLREWRALLASAGFDLDEVTSTVPPHWIIEGRPS
jgi:hypothetical protein